MARQTPKGRMDKRGMLDEMERQYISAGRKRGPGSYTASQTGARQLAERREQFRNMGMITKAANAGTGDFEDVISGKKKGY